MHCIELLLAAFCLIFLIAIAALFFNNFKSNLITKIATVFVVVSLIVIILSILMFIANSIMTLFIVWFGNW
ncbi:hypothetical protein [Clostridium paraputrificum]|uniref:hypothetical protein n=1 Tax=Clostridium paraputrificum TaxID=29363 RepID=UPI00189B41CE|nr:hypothetical protein [Clostridium paraputrificum]MDB2125247.1 hypothetical protein [Clostridium paraputrificum]DAQ99917.1 MAG TPA: hypothetical protein [Caudoviricetes sp.]